MENNISFFYLVYIGNYLKKHTLTQKNNRNNEINRNRLQIRNLNSHVYYQGIDINELCCGLLGERRETQILKFNTPPPTHLVCKAHLKANFLSFHISLVVVVNCGAGNALRGFEISMF